jgi:serine/threonine protein kinase
VVFGLKGLGVRLKGHEARCARRLADKSPKLPDSYSLPQTDNFATSKQSKGSHGSVTKMLLARIYENDDPPSDKLVRTKRVQITDFEICDKLGAGAYGNVWRCKKKCTGELFAMKLLVKKKYVGRKGAEAEFPRRERDALFLSGRHPHVAHLECAFETDRYWVLVTELCGLGSLAKHIKRDRGGLDAKEARVLGAQILEGLHHLHKMCILHRDIKPDNVGISGTKEAPIAKLIDFGFAKRAEAHQSKTIVGSYGYCAPEIAKGIIRFGALEQANDAHDGRIDIYSYGILLFVMFASCEARTDAPKPSFWSHYQFRAMLTNANHPMWTCSLYIDKGIEGGVILKKMQDSLALNAIMAMTETDPSLRTANTCAALQLQFFTDAWQ